MDVAQLNLHNFLGLQDCSGLVKKGNLSVGT